MLGNQVAAEDALQEAFINAFMKLDSFQGKSSFGAWLKRIVINKCLGHIKRQRMVLEPLQDHLIDESDPPPEDDRNLPD